MKADTAFFYFRNPSYFLHDFYKVLYERLTERRIRSMFDETTDLDFGMIEVIQDYLNIVDESPWGNYDIQETPYYDAYLESRLTEVMY